MNVATLINTDALGPIQRGKVITVLKRLECLRWQSVNRVPSARDPSQTITFVRIMIGIATTTPIVNPVAHNELLALCGRYAVLTKDTLKAFLAEGAAAIQRGEDARPLVDENGKPIAAPAPVVQPIA